MDLTKIDTPAILIDMDKVLANLHKMQDFADSQGLKLRPHIKTHKMPWLAKLQLENGAAGITCASVGEAECMVAHGIKDIFIAYEIIGPGKLKRLVDLMEKAKIITGVDSKEGADALNRAALERGLIAEVRIEIDTGMKRAGIHPDGVLELARHITALPGLKLTGIFTYKSSTLKGQGTSDNKAAAIEESDLMAKLAETLSRAGIPLRDISGGSTPTARFTNQVSGLTEIRPGSYIFGDVQRINAGAMEPQDCAATVATTVISVPAQNRAVIDGGSKVFSGDSPQNTSPLFIKGQGLITGRPDLVFARMNEEHGVIESLDGGPTNLHVGDILRIIPNHTCTSMNLFDYVHVIEKDGSIRRERVEARGMSY